MTEGWIYFVIARDGPGSRVKIGWGADPKKRVRELQIGSPIGLELLGAVAGTPKRERVLHKQWNRHRTHGEWFLVDVEMLQLLADEGEMLHPLVAEGLAVISSKQADLMDMAWKLWPVIVELRAAAERATKAYYDAGGDMTGELGEALDALDLTLAAVRNVDGVPA